MESQTNKKQNSSEDRMNNPKKNKSKDKKRLMTLFRGPKVEHKLFRKTTEEESEDIKQLVIDIMGKNSSLKLHQKKKKEDKTSEKQIIAENQTKDNNLKLTKDLVLGLNSIIRSIEKKSIIGVILTNPLALPLEDNIIELCESNQIGCISVHSLDQMKSYLNISSLSAIALKPNVVSNDSIFHELYEKFRNILDISCHTIESIESKDVKQEIEAKVNQKKDLKLYKSGVKPDKSQTSFDKSHPLFDSLYSKKSEDKYQDFVNKYFKNINESNQKKDEFITQQTLIKLSSKPEPSFPETNDMNKSLAKFEIILDEQQSDPNDDSFAQSLIDSMDESDLKPTKKAFKRKGCHKNEKQEPDFKNPRVVRVEPSHQKIQKRKQRKAMKRLTHSSKKS